MTTTEREREELRIMIDGCTGTTIHKIKIFVDVVANDADWKNIDERALWTLWKNWRSKNG